MSLPLFGSPPETAVRRLLEEAKLPGSDLSAGQLEHFFGCGAEAEPQGVVGLELYGEEALLRSLAVASSARGRGCARALVERAEHHARERGVRRLYLLTSGAAEFFSRLGYKAVMREQAPASIRATREFSALCPATAVLMRKEI